MNPSPDTDAGDPAGAPSTRLRAVRVVGVGHVALDHVFEVDTLPAAATKVTARHYRCSVGGMTANAMVAAARLGAQAAMVAPVSDDESLPIFLAHFQREGVDARGLKPIPGSRHSVSMILVDHRGERTIVSHRSDAGMKAGPLDLACLEGADVVLTDPRFAAWAQSALAHARSRRLLSILDADVAPKEDLEALVGLAAWAVFSEPGLEVYRSAGSTAADRRHTLADGLAQALSAGAQVAVVTLGDQGLMWQRQGGTVRSMPACQVGPVLDTTAAGDVFHGALGVALAQGWTDEAALTWASRAAALKCAHGQGVLGAPRLRDMSA